MNERTYNVIKMLSRLIFPTIGSIYFGLAKIYDLPNELLVIGVIIILALICGIILQIYSNRYNPKILFHGQIVVIENEDGNKVFSLELEKNPDEIASMDSITFKVTDQHSEEFD
ncbi:MAG: phage holin [Paenisporosarcina sp.]